MPGCRFARGPTTTLQPGINLVFECPHRACFRMNVSVDGQAFTFLPALGGAYLSTQINCNFFPGVQTVSLWAKHGPNTGLHWFAVRGRHFDSKPFLVQPA